jgi:Flp pilus assembly pilin Flp
MQVRLWYELLRASSRREEAQTMAEYGVVMALITLGVIVAITALALAINGKFGFITNTLSSAI